MAEEQQGRVKAEYRKRHAELEQQLRNATAAGPTGSGVELLALGAAADHSADDTAAKKEAALREKLRALHKRYEHEEPMAEEQQGRVKAEYRKRHAELEQQLKDATAAGPAGSGVELLAVGAAADHSADDAAAKKEAAL